MSKHKLHNLLNRLLLGRPYARVSKFIDQPYKSFGRRHRVARHDLVTICFLVFKSVEEALAAWLHIKLDKDKSLEEILKKLLEVTRND